MNLTPCDRLQTNYQPLQDLPESTVKDSRDWLSQYYPDDLEKIENGTYDLSTVEESLKREYKKFCSFIPSTLKSYLSIPSKGRYISFSNVIRSYLSLIGQMILNGLPELIIQSILSASRKSIVLFPCDPSVPYELMTVQQESVLISTTLHNTSAFGRIVGDHPNDAPIQCTLSILGTLQAHRNIDALIVADPTHNLRSAQEEAAALATASHVSSSILIGAEATLESVVQQMQSKKLIHFSCHGGLENEGKPYLLLNDKKLFGKHIPKLDSQPLVFANACISAGDLGFSGAGSLAVDFIKKGAMAFVGSMWPIASMKANMSARLFWDALLEKPLGTATMFLRNPNLSDQITENAYILFGDPLLSVFEPMMFSADAYYFSRLQDYYQGSEDYDLAVFTAEKGALCAGTMQEEFLYRAQHDQHNSELWALAAKLANILRMQIEIGGCLAKSALSEHRDDYTQLQEAALEILRKGLELKPEDWWFKSRFNAVMGEIKRKNGYGLLQQRTEASESNRTNMLNAHAYFVSASEHFEKAFFYEIGQQQRNNLIFGVHETNGLAKLCLVIAKEENTQEEYDLALEALYEFEKARTFLPAQDSLLIVEEFVINGLIKLNVSTLKSLEDDVERGELSQAEYQKLRGEISNNIEVFERLLHEIQSELAQNSSG